jgi:hypothetical protein
MQSLATILRVQGTSKELLPHASQFFDPAGIERCELGFELTPQSLRERGTLPGGRNGDLQIPPANDCGIVEVAAIGVIDNVAKNLAAPGFTVDGVVHLNGRSSRYHEEGRIKVCALEFARLPREDAGTFPRHNGRRCSRRDYAHIGARYQQAADL